MGTKITAISNKSISNQSTPRGQLVFSTERPWTCNPPKTIAPTHNNNPVMAHFFCLLSIKLNRANRKEAIIVAVNTIFIDSPVYTSLNCGVVNHSGYLKQITPIKESSPKKIEE